MASEAAQIPFEECPQKNKLDHCATKFSLTTEYGMKKIVKTYLSSLGASNTTNQIKQASKKHYDIDVAKVNTVIRPDPKLWILPTKLRSKLSQAD